MQKAKHVTIFGGTGFIGRYLVDRLADMGFVVRVATRRPSSTYFLRTAGSVGQVVGVACNIHDDTSFAAAICGSDYVVNLIGTLAEKGKNTFDALHVQFPGRLGRIAKLAGVQRVVHISALGADEKAPSLYAQSKARGENYLLAEFSNATILRPSIVFGAEDKFFNLFARMASVAPVLPLIGGGKTVFQPVFVGDVVQAIVNALTFDQGVQGKIFELGGPEKLSFKQCIQRIMTHTNVHRPMITLPFAVAKAQGAILQYLPGPLLTLDQVRSLTVNNVVSGHLSGFKDLQIDPMPLDAILPGYLSCYRKGGRFADHHKVARQK